MALQPLGSKTVAAAGTPEQLTTTREGCQSILIQALPTNTGKVWIGTSAINTGTFAGVLYMLPTPSGSDLPSVSFSIPLAPAGLNAADLWLDVDVSGDGVIVTIATQ